MFFIVFVSSLLLPDARSYFLCVYACAIQIQS